MSKHPGRLLACALVVIVSAAIAPAGLSGRPIPAWAWLLWTASLGWGLCLFWRAGLRWRDAIRRAAWLLPVVAFFAAPAALLAPAGTRVTVAAALMVRAWSAASLGAGLATFLGPAGLARGVRQLGVTERLADVFEATLASLAIVLRQAGAMLRAREARRPGYGAWSSVVAAPVETARGFGRLVAALLLRSLERAEAIEQARRARGGVS
jgi:energy-coupling factor transporter transmembrane protein EcfT